MPATSLESSQEFDSVKSILTELNAIYQQQSEIRETFEAKGVPAVTVNLLATQSTTDSTVEFRDHCASAVKAAEHRFGKSALKQNELEVGLRKLIELDEDALYVRRIAKGMNLDAQAISMLTNVIRQNPGDNGNRVLSALVEYAGEYGIKLESLRVIEGGASEPASVLPNIVIAENSTGGILRHKAILAELLLAAVVTYTALMLLT